MNVLIVYAHNEPQSFNASMKTLAVEELKAQGHDALGGMQLPLVVEKAGFAWINAANIGTATFPFLTIGNANLLLAHGTRAQIDTFVRPGLEGRYCGTMCLSEPQAGSSLSDITTRTEHEGDSPRRSHSGRDRT